MGPIVITEINLAARLYRSGILRYFSSDDLSMHITDLCYSHKTLTPNNDRMLAKKMQDDGTLKVVGLTEGQMQQAALLHGKHKPKFIFKTVSALVYAKHGNMMLISEDELLRDVARSEFNLKVHDKIWMLDNMVQDIIAMGIKIDSDLIKEII